MSERSTQDAASPAAEGGVGEVPDRALRAVLRIQANFRGRQARREGERPGWARAQRIQPS